MLGRSGIKIKTGIWVLRTIAAAFTEDTGVQLNLVGMIIQVSQGVLDAYVTSNAFEILVPGHAEEVSEIIQCSYLPDSDG